MMFMYAVTNWNYKMRVIWIPPQ